MRVESHKSLKAFNTFGIDCKARHFVSVSSISDLKEVLTQKLHPSLFILGGGSNMLLTKDVDAFVAHINLKGISIISETDSQVLVEAMAGENWHELVQYTIQNDFGGLENLSLIPGNVGTAPIQNIGAYGVELKDVFENCTAYNVETLEKKVFSKEDCKFGYRNSIFKNEAKGKYVITSVVFNLSRTNHVLSTSYGAIQAKLEENNIDKPTIADISKAVIAIRQSKLPDPAVLGNSGSFFKNPIILSAQFKEFRRKHPQAPFYEVSATEFKIPAGWLIEQAGFKGQRFGDAGVHKNQALVLVNYENAEGSDILNLAKKIQSEVTKRFSIDLEMEVNII